MNNGNKSLKNECNLKYQQKHEILRFKSNKIGAGSVC